MLKYRITASGSPASAAEIYIYGDIGEDWMAETVAATDFVRDLNELKNEQIVIRINSVGGSVPDGIAIYNAIARHPSNTTIMIDGMAMSIASLIAMAGDQVHMADNAVMMIHAPWTVAAGNANEFRVTADMLDTWAAAMATSYAKKTGMSEAEVMSSLLDGEDHYFTAAEAQAKGLVDALVEAVPVAASLRVPEQALARLEIPSAATEPFVIKAARAAPTEGGSVMDRKQKIRALFQAHMDNPDIAALCDACIEDESVDVARATGELRAALDAISEAKAADKSAADVAAAVESGIQAEASRRNGIQAAFKPFMNHEGVSDLLDSCVSDHTVDVQSANAKLLKALGERTEPVAGNVVVRPNPERAKFEQGIVASLLVRAGKGTQEDAEAAKASGMHNFSLMEHAKASLVRAGTDIGTLTVPQIAQAALTQTTSDFSVLLENAMHKAMQASYSTAPDTWSRFCAIGSVSDFRAHNRYRTGSLGNYGVVNEAGEYQNANIPDGEKSQISAEDRGMIINVTYQMIINDDVGAFVGLASDLGRAGARTIESLVYAALAENGGLGPNLLDGNPLFHASRNNIGAGSALTVDGIEADRVLMASQKDISGNDFLDIRPQVLLLPIGLGGTARVINDAQYDPDATSKLQRPNKVRGLFGDIVDTPRLTGTRRYLFANPADVPAMEVAFLNGERAPQIMMEDSFNSRGVRWRATLDCGVAAIDGRGAVTNAGA